METYQQLAPVHPWPPHCPYLAAHGVLARVVVVVLVVVVAVEVAGLVTVTVTESGHRKAMKVENWPE